MTTAVLGNKLVIVNLQKTPINELAALVIHAKVDDMMDLLMQKLEMTIPEWQIERQVQVRFEESDTKKENMIITGVKQNGDTFDYLKAVEIEG